MKKKGRHYAEKDKTKQADIFDWLEEEEPEEDPKEEDK